MGLRAYLLATTKDDLKQREFVKAVREIEDTPGVSFVDPVVGSRDMVVMVDAPVTVEALAKKIGSKSWVKDLEVLRIVSLFRPYEHETTGIPPAESADRKPEPELLNV